MSTSAPANDLCANTVRLSEFLIHLKAFRIVDPRLTVYLQGLYSPI